MAGNQPAAPAELGIRSFCASASASGIWLDRTLQKSPLFLLIGAGAGIIAGTVGSVRIATRAIAAAEQACKEHERKEDEA